MKIIVCRKNGDDAIHCAIIFFGRERSLFRGLVSFPLEGLLSVGFCYFVVPVII